MAFTLPDLPYPFNALEPHIDAKTMEIHHDKHHGTYVSKLNAALEKAPGLQNKKIEEILQSLESVPAEVRTAVRNHGGGHYNHTLFWKMLSPKGGGKPSGALASAIDRSFGSFDAFKQQFSDAAAALFGSGWAWLARDKAGNFAIEATANEVCPLMEGKWPLLVVDVWEHAYYLKYQNRRPDYVQAWWNVVNWDEVNRRLK